MQNDKYQQMSFDLKPIRLDYDSDARRRFAHHRSAGDFVECPCCGKKYNIKYKRRLYASIIRGLRNLINGQNVTSSIGDFAKLRFWGLIEPMGETGEWRATQRGRDFIAGVLSVPKFIILQNNVLVGQSSELITVYDVRD